MELQRCTRCKEVLPLLAFSPSQVGRLGAWCRNCLSQYTRDRRAGITPIRAADDCQWCGTDIRHLRSHARFCSTSCCAKSWRRDNPGQTRVIRLRSMYGISTEEFDALLASQGGVCAICETNEPGARGWHLDHDHATSFPRGILCSWCNQGLGHFQDNPAVLQSAIDYLKTTNRVAHKTTRAKTRTKRLFRPTP